MAARRSATAATSRTCGSRTCRTFIAPTTSRTTPCCWWPASSSRLPRWQRSSACSGPFRNRSAPCPCSGPKSRPRTASAASPCGARVTCSSSRSVTRFRPTCTRMPKRWALPRRSWATRPTAACTSCWWKRARPARYSALARPATRRACNTLAPWSNWANRSSRCARHWSRPSKNSPASRPRRKNSSACVVRG